MIVNELNLMLRVMDRPETGPNLEERMIFFFGLLWYTSDNKGKPPSEKKKSIHFLTTVLSLGNFLNVRRTKDSKKLKWTSLLGEEKQLLLIKLPYHFEKLLPPQRAPLV
ncbi:unnamed protein product [Porites evermanni]|uniref:Uncharacterized protein n=1 Tax=Porites evermanni TaxID=104178 RepID=A0ABN8RNT6_9CNID|nr:unnamed protein product [Porites evermanni]